MRYLLPFALLATIGLSSPAARGAETTIPELIGTLQSLQSQDEGKRVAAIDQLAAKAEQAAAAVPVLSDLLEDSSAAVRAHAARALGQIGPAAKPAVQALAKLVGDPKPAVGRAALEALSEIRPGPKVGVPLFGKLMEHGDPGLRTRAMACLAEAGPEAVPFLQASLKNEKAAYWACLVLRDIGPAAKPATEDLAALVNDPRPEIRREAILALAAIGPGAAAAAPQIAATLDKPETAAAATYALGAIGSLPTAAEIAVRANVQSKDKILAAASIFVLAKIHADNKHYTRWATVALANMLKNSDARVRRAAAQALGALRPAPEIAQPIMEEAFKNVEPQVLTGAMDALAGLGAPALPRLITALKNEKIRPRVVYILGQMGPTAAPAVDAIVGLLDDPNPQTQEEALIALAKIGPAAKAAVPALDKALSEREGAACYGVAYALGRIGPDAAAAAPALLKTLASKDASVALISAWALVQIHPAAKDHAAKIVPIAIEGLASSAVEERLVAIETLADLGSLAKSAAPALEKAQQDEDKTVRQAAAAALKAIGDQKKGQ
jgi:HEAT repeat protein